MKRTTTILTSFGFFLIAASILSPLPKQTAAYAQEGNNAAPKCMSRTLTSGETFRVFLPASDIGSMQARGFELENCNVHFSTQEQRENWRDRICQLASLPNKEFHDQYEQEMGQRPNVLCGMAELATTRWQRGGKK